MWLIEIPTNKHDLKEVIKDELDIIGLDTGLIGLIYSAWPSNKYQFTDTGCFIRNEYKISSMWCIVFWYFICVWNSRNLCVYTILVCTGRLKLFSSEHNQGMYIQPEELRNTLRNKKKLKEYYSSNQPFDLATVKGNCCWKVWSRYRFGQNFGMGNELKYSYKSQYWINCFIYFPLVA